MFIDDGQSLLRGITNLILVSEHQYHIENLATQNSLLLSL